MDKGTLSPRMGEARHAAPALAAVLVAMVAGVAHGQAPAPIAAPAPGPAAALAPAPSPVFSIRGFKITGDNPLGDGETSSVLAPFLRADANMDVLQQATVALETALRAKGYGLHRVSLPPQEVGDTITLHIIKFTVAKVTVEGATLNDADNIRRSVPELREGQTPNFRRLAVQAAIANENPNKQLTVGVKESDEADKIDATLTVKESRPWNFGISAANSGSESTGRDRVTLSGSHSNLFNRDHQFVGAYTTSVERTSDVKQLGLTYRVPLYELGGVVGASYTRSDVVGTFGTFNSTGAGHTLGLNYTMYLPPNGGYRSYVMLGLEDKLFNAARINDLVLPGASDRRSRPITLSYNARVETNTSVWGYNLDFAFNTVSGSANNLSSYRSEDPRIDTAAWKALRGGLQYSAAFAKSWVWAVRGQFQYSGDVLISGEQFGLGGQASVRGTAIERPLSADKGLSGTLELTSPELATGLRALGFVDAGWLANNNANVAKPSSDRLASVGLGLRYASGPLAVSLDYGRLVTGSKVPVTLNSSVPQKGDDRVYLNLSLRF